MKTKRMVFTVIAILLLLATVQFAVGESNPWLINEGENTLYVCRMGRAGTHGNGEMQWRSGEGWVEVPPGDSVSFLTSSPLYLKIWEEHPDGTLQEVLPYGRTAWKGQFDEYKDSFSFFTVKMVHRINGSVRLPDSWRWSLVQTTGPRANLNPALSATITELILGRFDDNNNWERGQVDPAELPIDLGWDWDSLVERETFYRYPYSGASGPIRIGGTSLPVVIDGLSLSSGFRILGRRPIPANGGNAFIHFEQNDSFFQPGDDEGSYNTCGPTSLEMVLHYYGKSETMRDIWYAGGINSVEVGTSPNEMRRALNRLDVPAYYFNKKSKNYGSDPFGYLRRYVRENRPPCILVRYPGAWYHWMVVVGYHYDSDAGINEYLLADPARATYRDSGFRWFSHADLDEYWSTRAAEDSDDTDFFWGSFRDFGANRVINPYTAIVPKNGASASSFHEGLWTELRVHEQYGEIGPTVGTVLHFIPFIGQVINFVVDPDVRDWDEELEFHHPFDFYHASFIKLASFGGTAVLTDYRPVGDSKIELEGRIEDGVLERGRMWVFVRTFRRNFLEDAPEEDEGTIHVEVIGAPSRVVSTRLLPNYPNPFNPETWIPYELSDPAEVTVSIYSVDGTLVRRLELGQMPSGVYRGRSRAAYWDGRNAVGEPVASGIYFYTLTAGDFTSTRKMVIRK